MQGHLTNGADRLNITFYYRELFGTSASWAEMFKEILTLTFDNMMGHLKCIIFLDYSKIAVGANSGTNSSDIYKISCCNNWMKLAITVWILDYWSSCKCR